MALNGHAELAGFLVGGGSGASRARLAWHRDTAGEQPHGDPLESGRIPGLAGSSLVGDTRADCPSAKERGMLGSGPCGRIQDQSLSSVSHAPRGCCLLAAPCARKVAALLPLPQLSTMSEGWVDCPTLGPGWKRREAYRRSGATCGRTDTYYQGPNGEKFRSKIELTRFLGPSQDLTNFDFKNGVLRDPPPKVKKAQKRCLSLSEPEPPVLPEQPPPKQQPVKPEPPEQPPPPLPERRPRKRPAPLLEPQESAQDAVVACCASCQNYFPGVMLPSQRRCRWLCPDCRAQRRDFNREQRFFKRVGCGACQACQIPEDCGICTVCAVRAKNPELRIGRKCLLRRCLKIVKKGFGCGVCQGCQATEDCGSCYICLRRLKPGLKRQWKCLKRRCLKKKQKSVVAKKAGYGPRKLTLKWKPSLERDPGGLSGSRRRKQLGKITEKKKPGRPPKHPSARARSSLEKERPPGGELRFLAEKGVAEAPGQLVLLKDRPGRDFVLLRDAPQSFPLLLQHVKEEPATPPPPGRLEEPAPTLVCAVPPLVKQEKVELGWDLAPVPAGVPRRMEGRGLASEVVVLDPADKDEEEEERTPVIMEIYSLGALAGRTPLDPVLREFLAELQEIPLPAHWEVQPPLGGPDLRLVQRSARSTMAATVIHIRPGLFFQVVVRQLPVPPEHEVYASHPARLTTVDEVVELICDLEAYRLCPGWPAGWHAGQRSQACDVLVYAGCCPQCRLNPWPSGSAGP
uniref:Methyl-CpG-binding domain protein 1 n=1 Tax=Gopherus evgoodei TaxID=1825980 RepID=A0A8C4Y5M5_9SAUR